MEAFYLDLISDILQYCRKKGYDGIFESYVLCIAAEIFDEKNISEDNFIVYCI